MLCRQRIAARVDAKLDAPEARLDVPEVASILLLGQLKGKCLFKQRLSDSPSIQGAEIDRITDQKVRAIELDLESARRATRLARDVLKRCIEAEQIATVAKQEMEDHLKNIRQASAMMQIFRKTGRLSRRQCVAANRLGRSLSVTMDAEHTCIRALSLRHVASKMYDFVKPAFYFDRALRSMCLRINDEGRIGCRFRADNNCSALLSPPFRIIGGMHTVTFRVLQDAPATKLGWQVGVSHPSFGIEGCVGRQGHPGIVMNRAGTVETAGGCIEAGHGHFQAGDYVTVMVNTVAGSLEFARNGAKLVTFARGTIAGWEWIPAQARRQWPHGWHFGVGAFFPANADRLGGMLEKVWGGGDSNGVGRLRISAAAGSMQRCQRHQCDKAAPLDGDIDPLCLRAFTATACRNRIRRLSV